jgi:hypothetical protein
VKKKQIVNPVPVPVPVEKESMWVVMRALSFDSLETMGRKLSAPAGGPFRFMPVFENKGQAVAFEGGCEDNIREIREL